VIAAVNGFALGGGFELVLCCDLVVAADTARMGLPEIKLGLVPGGGGTQRSVAKLGVNLANLLMLTGGLFPADRFVACGLVAEIVPEADLVPRAMELAAAIAAEPPEAVQGLKRLAAMAHARAPGGLDAEQALVTALYRSETGQRRVQEFAARSAARAARGRPA
jgi:enoyl-CoA hydratase/3-hydroxypropionyl-coenzyme A dehydratase